MVSAGKMKMSAKPINENQSMKMKIGESVAEGVSWRQNNGENAGMAAAACISSMKKPRKPRQLAQ
jgi:hypothetical protein